MKGNFMKENELEGDKPWEKSDEEAKSKKKRKTRKRRSLGRAQRLKTIVKRKDDGES